MKKLITLFTITIALIVSLAIPTKARTMYDDICNIVASVGETMSEIGISYHTNIEGSYIIYGTASNLTPSKRVDPEVHLWGRAASAGEEDQYPAFEDRYVCNVNLTELKPYTTYYYQVIAGSTKSAVCKFNTGLNETTTKFAWLTDTQTFTNGYNTVEDNLQRLLAKDKNLAFCLITGDITDRGGQEAQWNSFFSQVKSVQSMTMATVPGNHEYYTTGNPGYDSPEIYNQYFNNPDNSFEGRMNSSYYFKYNNILFLMIDTIKAELVSEHRAWIKNVLDNNTASYIIVGMHCGLTNSGQEYAGDASRMRQAYQDIFENYSVDLVLSGHEHIFSVEKTRLKNEVNPDLGVTYVVGAAGGNKSYLASSVFTKTKDYYQNLNYAGCIIKVNDLSLTLTLYNVVGDEQYSFSIPNRRYIDNYNESKFFDSVELVQDKEKETSQITWKNNIYGHITSATITGKEVNLYRESPIKEITRKINLANVNFVDLGSTYSDTNYYYTITFTKEDGTTLEKTFELINNPDLLIKYYNVVFKDANGNILKEESVKEGESATAPTAPTKEGYDFNGWSQDFSNVTSDLEVTPKYVEIVPEKKGCKKSAVEAAISTIITLSLAVAVLRKKEN